MNNSSERYDKIFSDAIIVSLDFLKGNNILLDSSDDNTVSRQSAHLGLQIFNMIKKLKDDSSNQSDQHVWLLTFNQQNLVKSTKKESDNNIVLNQLDNNAATGNKTSTKTNPGNRIISSQSLVVESLPTESVENSSADVQQSVVDSEEEGASVSSKKANSDFVESSDEDEVSDWHEDVDDNCSTSSDKSHQSQQNTHVNKYTKPVLDDVEQKIKIAKLFRKYPHWTMKKLNERSGYDCKKLSRRDVNHWIKDLETGGSELMRIRLVNKWVYAKCCEYKDKNKKIKDEILKKWAVQGNKILFAQRDHHIPFKASLAWMTNFKVNIWLENYQ